jgi:hypothetical protein
MCSPKNLANGIWRVGRDLRYIPLVRVRNGWWKEPKTSFNREKVKCWERSELINLITYTVDNSSSCDSPS